MPFDDKAIIQQIDQSLTHVSDLIGKSKYDDLSDLSQEAAGEATSVLSSTIERLAPRGSVYLKNAKNCEVAWGPHHVFRSIRCLIGVLKALRQAYDQRYLQSIQELVHAELFSDFLQMAEYLLEQGYKDPAAVIVGSVLEGHLRKLCEKHSVSFSKADGSHKKADALNSDLSTASVYSRLDQKNITAWLDLRNKAAHGHYGEYSKEQVSLMLQSVQDFLTRCSA